MKTQLLFTPHSTLHTLISLLPSALSKKVRLPWGKAEKTRYHFRSALSLGEKALVCAVSGAPAAAYAEQNRSFGAGLGEVIRAGCRRFLAPPGSSLEAQSSILLASRQSLTGIIMKAGRIVKVKILRLAKDGPWLNNHGRYGIIASDCDISLAKEEILMMNKRYLVALDQGTTSSRAVVFTLEGHMIASANQEFPQHYPHPGWVEHDPADILSSQIESLRAAVRKAEIDPEEIAAIGITNQRETTFLWERDTGACLHNAIVWQCRRTAPLVDEIMAMGWGPAIKEKTGLVADAYFSGTKIKWLLDELNLRDRARKGEICFGTVDSFLAWHLVEGHPHVTDATNAGRTMLFNLHTQDWDEELLDMLDIPRAILPRVVDTAQVIGYLREDLLGVKIPVAALVGDQHAALFGQACFHQGDVKNTYGTGCFMLMNAGEEFRLSQSGLLTTMAWRLNGKPTYAFEGSVFMGGAAIQWLRDEMKLISSAKESEAVAATVPDTGGVYLVPAFTGLGAPYWNMYTRGTLVGMTRGTGRAHIVRAALESIAFQSRDLFAAMAQDCGAQPSALRVDGGASANGLLMQLQSDLLNVPVQRPAVLETTALGAALLAGLAVGIYHDLSETAQGWHVADTFTPRMLKGEREDKLRGWRRAVDAALYWAKQK